MGKSARVLGREFGRTAGVMNRLLREHGYLDGEPGAYGLTEKGKRYGEEQYHSRGTGGYAHYNRSWETRTWSDETSAALRADMEAAAKGGDAKAVKKVAYEFEPVADYSGSEDDEPQHTWTEVAVSGAMIGALLIAPHAKPFWNNKVKPAVKQLRDRVARAEPARSTES